MKTKKSSNKIIEVQEVLFQEIKRLNDTDTINFANSKMSKHEFDRATSIYNTTTGFIKTINTQLAIRNIAKRENTQYKTLLHELGVVEDGE